jgi:hypothetical protein
MPKNKEVCRGRRRRIYRNRKINRELRKARLQVKNFFREVYPELRLKEKDDGAGTNERVLR